MAVNLIGVIIAVVILAVIVSAILRGREEHGAGKLIVAALLVFGMFAFAGFTVFSVRSVSGLRGSRVTAQEASQDSEDEEEAITAAADDDLPVLSADQQSRDDETYIRNERIRVVGRGEATQESVRARGARDAAPTEAALRPAREQAQKAALDDAESALIRMLRQSPDWRGVEWHELRTRAMALGDARLRSVVRRVLAEAAVHARSTEQTEQNADGRWKLAVASSYILSAARLERELAVQDTRSATDSERGLSTWVAGGICVGLLVAATGLLRVVVRRRTPAA